MENLRIFIRREIWDGGGFSVYISQRLENGQLVVGKPIVMEAVPAEMQCVSHPAAIYLSGDDAQRFIDELWNAGLRPTEGSGSAGSLAATQRHLEDMRALVFKGKIEPQKTKT